MELPEREGGREGGRERERERERERGREGGGERERFRRWVGSNKLTWTLSKWTSSTSSRTTMKDGCSVRLTRQ